jgi:xanthosine utilization system XapX-like protein
MLKQVILIVVLSLIAIFFRVELSHLLNALVYVHNQVSHLLHMIFAEGATGRVIQNLISLLIIPFVCGLIVGVVFWLVKREAMPHIMAVVWVLWLILLITMLAQTGMGGKTTVNRMAKHHNRSMMMRA